VVPKRSPRITASWSRCRGAVLLDRAPVSEGTRLGPSPAERALAPGPSEPRRAWRRARCAASKPNTFRLEASGAHLLWYAGVTPVRTTLNSFRAVARGVVKRRTFHPPGPAVSVSPNAHPVGVVRLLVRLVGTASIRRNQVIVAARRNAVHDPNWYVAKINELVPIRISVGICHLRNLHTIDRVVLRAPRCNACQSKSTNEQKQRTHHVSPPVEKPFPTHCPTFRTPLPS